MCTHRFWILVFVVVTWLAGGSGDAIAQTSLPGDNSLLFVENVGQFEPPVRFLVRAGDETLWLLDDALWVSRSAALGMRSATRITFDGANPSPTVTPFGAQDVHLHYYIGADPTSWRTNVPVWRGVRYANLYPGVHLEVYAQSGRWTWRLTGSGNMASAAARLNVESADVHATSWLPPLLAPANTAATSAQPEDVPASLVWSTFLGGSSVDAATDIALDSSGAAFVTGATTSPDLPTTPGLGATLSGNSDAFVARLKADGSGVHYLTYLGGAYNPPPEFATWWMDQSNAITIDANGAAYITGQTFSNDFPTTAGAFDTTYNGGEPCETHNDKTLNCGDAFVAKLGADGRLVYSTYLGGSYLPGVVSGGDDNGQGIAVSADGRIFVTGFTTSWDFPTTPGAFKRIFAREEYGLKDDIILSVFNPAGGGSADLLYSTFIGGGYEERGSDIAVDAAGFAYITGYHAVEGSDYIHIWPDFPSTVGAFDPGPMVRGARSFVIKFFPGGQGASDLRYSTLFGSHSSIDSNGVTEGHAIALDAAGDVYISGYTSDEEMMTTPGAFARSRSGWADAFVARFNLGSQGAADLRYATFLGGADYEVLEESDLALDASGDIYVTGETGSQDFPVTAGAYQRERAGSDDVFVARLRPAGQGANDLIYGSYVGASDNDLGLGIGVAAPGVVLVAGYTDSDSFPTTPGAFDTTFGDCDSWLCLDGIVFKLAMAEVTTPDVDAYLTAPPLAPGPAASAAAIPITFGNKGATDAVAVAITATLHISLTYVADTLGVTPVVNGSTMVWTLSQPLSFGDDRNFVLTVGLPDAPLDMRLPVALAIDSAGPETIPENNQATTDAWVALQFFLPVIRR
ncbi:MAG: hypothetical protein BroJett021_22080 [Chloroflexota bacterium]|nr:SBBP repeat-containing protein [Caldilinea sp.]GIK73220.1 MAG: hypothetical protein BroJett021_22080 [Chloroflexota bacterium]